jgi:hypothetical protein
LVDGRPEGIEDSIAIGVSVRGVTVSQITVTIPVAVAVASGVVTVS